MYHVSYFSFIKKCIDLWFDVHAIDDVAIDSSFNNHLPEYYNMKYV